MRFWQLLALLCCADLSGSAAAEPPDQRAQQAPSAKHNTSSDRYGDPLPAGAFARLGTVRFRVPGSIAGVSWSLDGKALLVRTTAQKIHMLDATTGKTIEVFGFPAHMEVSNAAITSDAALLAGQDGRGAVQLLDLSTGRLRPPLGVMRDFQLGLEFSRNGRVLVAGANGRVRDEDCPVRAWNIADGKPLGPFKMPPCWESHAAVAPDGQLMAGWGQHLFAPSSSFKKRPSKVQVWELPSGKELPHLQCRVPIASAGFSPDGKKVAIAGADGSIQLFDPRTGKELKRLGQMPDESDQQSLTEDQKIERKLREVARRLQREEAQVEESIHCLVFSPDGKRLLSASSTEAVVWDVSTGARLGRGQAPPGEPAAVTIHGDTIKACSTCGAAVRVWAVPQLREPPRPEGHVGCVSSVAFSADDRSVVSVAPTGEVYAWDVATQRGTYKAIGDDNAKAPPGPNGRMESAVSPEGKYLVRLGQRLTDAEQQRMIEKMLSGSASSEQIRKSILAQPLRVNDVGSGSMLHDVDIDIFGEFLTSFSADGRVALSAGISTEAKATVALWDVATGQVKRRFHSERSLDGVALSPDGGRVAVASTSMAFIRFMPKSDEEEKPEAVIYDTRNGEKISSFSSTLSSSHALAFSDDGSRLAVGTRDGLIVLRNATTGKRLGTIGGASNAQIGALLFSPDGRTLAATMSDPGSARLRIQLIEMASGGLRKEFECDSGDITSLAFSHHGRILASGSADSTVLLWDLTGRRAAPPPTRDDIAPEAMERLWSRLSAPDARTGYEAVARLLESPGATVSLLRAKMKAETEKPPTHVEIVEMIRKLDDARFSVRDTAAERLLDAAERAKEPLEQSLEQSPSPETRGRLTRLIKSIELCHASRDRLRLLRAVEVLEGLGTPEARELLKDLAKGRPEARLTREANASLERLARQRL